MRYPDAMTPHVDKHGQEWITRALLAKRLGITQAGTYHGEKKEWIKGRIKLGVKMFPSPQSEKAYTQNSPKLSSAPVEDEDAPIEEEKTRGRPPTSLQSATATKTKLAAELMRLEYETKLGKLVPYDAVHSVWTNVAETIKKSLLTIPDRIAPEFGGENVHGLYRALTTEIQHSLASLNIKHAYEVEINSKKGGRKLGR